MPFLLAEILNFQGSTHHIGVGSFSYLDKKDCFFKLKEYPEGNGHDTGGFREWIL